jgi:hypothetical protein
MHLYWLKSLYNMATLDEYEYYTILTSVLTRLPTANTPDTYAEYRGYTDHSCRRNHVYTWRICHQHRRSGCFDVTYRYRPVGLTPSGTGCLASGTISVSHPKHSGEASGESSRSSSVTTPNLATGKRSQKLSRQLCLPLSEERLTS